MRLLRTKCVACVGNRVLISRSSVTSEGRRIELARVVTYVQGTYEIEIGRDRVGGPARSSSLARFGCNGVALYEAHASNVLAHP